MADTKQFSKEQEAIIAAQNAAGSRLPDDAEARRLLIFNWRTAQGREADAVAKVKEDVGAKGLLDNLTKKHGLEKAALDFIKAVFAMDPLKRARAIRQVFIVSDDYSWIIRDLFDEGAFGVGSGDDQGSVFDATTTGKRQGGAKAEPRTVAQMAASNAGPAPTPGLDLTTPEARAAVVAKYEEAAAARKGKRGPLPPEFKELKANAELAKEAEKAAQAPGATPPADEQPPAPPTEGSNVVSFAKQQGKDNEAGEKHIREQAAKLAAERAAETAPTPTPEKAKRGGGKKGATKAPDPIPQASNEEPPAPPPEDDDEGEGPDFHSAPTVGAHQVGDQPSTYTVR